MPPRLFCLQPLIAEADLVLPEAASHHIARVLRRKPGDALTLFDGRGGEYDAVIGSIDTQGVTVHIGEWLELERESRLHLVLAQGISSGERMDLTVQKAVELGVAKIQPLVTRRSVVRLDTKRGAARVAHWQRVAICACEQCGRNRVPSVAPLLSLPVWLAEEGQRTTRLFLSLYAEKSLRELDPPACGITLLVGPEGGFDPDEQAAARVAGFLPVRLGSRVLRTETAALAALAAMQALWGDF